MNARRVMIQAPQQIEVVDFQIPEPGSGQVLIRTLCTGISAGTELLAYRNEYPNDPVDVEVDPHAGQGSYPMQTGYSSVGIVDRTGPGVDPSWCGARVFAFAPHSTHNVVDLPAVIRLPDEIDAHLATLIPNLETAVGLVMDARPLLGERVVVFGQGIVGLLVTRVLARFPLGLLAAVDPLQTRRERALTAGATVAIDPTTESDWTELQEHDGFSGEPTGADLIFELSGNPDALNQAISLAGFGSRIVVGSWYGDKRSPLNLGGRFHRNRISLISSQVSTVDPTLSARWTKSRRMNEVVRLLPELDLDDLITHCVPIGDAKRAFELLSEDPGSALHVVLTCS
jgi:2-desacetyl-2-hydroxyethyl bacteriochlorophyllide A dehydrogenase